MAGMSVERTEIPAFDSHRYVKRLIQTGMPEAQAEAVVEVHVHVLNSNLATRQDLALVHKDIEVVRKDTEIGLAGLRKELEVGLAGVRKDMEVGLAGLRKELEVGLAQVDARIVSTNANTMRWMIGIMVAGFIGLAGITLNS